ncbi:hypothetical protein AB0N05_35920 [Nocardia sp. NPDC051030]|uniref:hypothetical protein n=1 Tax=Nocardia sp. NPDC051030 TaxID=3155162 RepID=UPI003432F345
MVVFDRSLDQVIDIYCAAWSDPDPQRRRKLLGEVWAEGATYTDPTVHVVGMDALLAHIDSVVGGRPGATIVRSSAVDAHHGVARFAWRMVMADGSALPDGLDFAELSETGHIRRIVGFFGGLGPIAT